MTRLATHDIAELSDSWNAYEQRLQALTGHSLAALSAQVAGVDEHEATHRAPLLRVGVIPIATGEGVIPVFADALQSIAAHLGFQTRRLAADLAGFAEARAKGCDLILWADDEHFFVEHCHTDVTAENGRATGQGFATALRHMVVRQQCEPRTLILGAGPVGRSAMENLLCAGYAVTLCDLDISKAKQVCHALGAGTPCTPADIQMQRPFSSLLDAAPTATCFPANQLTPDACIAAPCVPCPWPDVPTAPGAPTVPGVPTMWRVWHDPLQLGTAVMLYTAAYSQPHAQKRTGRFIGEALLIRANA